MLEHDLAGHLSVFQAKEIGPEGSITSHSVGKFRLASKCSWFRKQCLFQYNSWLCVDLGFVPLSPELLLSPLLIQLWYRAFQKCCSVGGVLGSVTHLMLNGSVMLLSECDLAHQISLRLLPPTRPAPPFFCPKPPAWQGLLFHVRFGQRLLQQKSSLVRLYWLSWCHCLKIRGKKSAEEIIKINIGLSTNNSNLWTIMNI